MRWHDRKQASEMRPCANDSWCLASLGLASQCARRSGGGATWSTHKRVTKAMRAASKLRIVATKPVGFSTTRPARMHATTMRLQLRERWVACPTAT